MTRPEDVRLTVISASGSQTSTVSVRYIAVFTAPEAAGNLTSRETIQLLGQDPTPCRAGDDPLLVFPPCMVRPDGQRRRVFLRAAQVPNSRLDEDCGSDEGEVYAQVCLRRLGQLNPPVRCARSAILSQLVAETPAS